MPISAAVMNEGGMMLFVFVKFALVLAGAAAVLLTLRWVRSDRPGAVALYVFTLAAIRGSTVALEPAQRVPAQVAVGVAAASLIV